MAIDEIKDAGTFVEVEVLSDDETSALAMISEIETKLDLDSAEVVTRPYRDICMGLESRLPSRLTRKWRADVDCFHFSVSGKLP